MKGSPSLGSASRSLVVALVVVLLVGLGLLAKAWMQPPTQPELNVGRTVVEEFLQLVRDGHADEAWDAATAEFKSIEGRESFIRTAAKTPVLMQQLQFNSAQEIAVQKQPRTEYLFQPREGKLVRVLVGYEGGVWKVDRLTL